VSLETYGRYQLIKKLATGGMAQIYLARQVGLEGFEKLLVVKRILPHLAENEDFITMFLDEARIAARLNHPNVVQIFDLGQQDDTFFIAMEYIHGEDVRKVWKQAEREGTGIPLPLICRIIIEACAGLDYAHKKVDPGGRPLNIVHRDISPQNILVSFEGGVKVVDFGIAKAADQATVTRSGVLKGKYSYMSPEQAQGKSVDARTDVFALGVVLYELLTDTRLFKRANDIQTLNAVTECQVTPPSGVDSRLPKDLDPIVMKALAKDRDQRYADARELQQALEDWLLENTLPSSAVHLAAFMQDIYAERLAREAEEGRLAFVESGHDLSKSEGFDKATPNKPTKSIRTPTVARQATGPKSRPTLTKAERSGPGVKQSEAGLALGADVRPPPTEHSLPTQNAVGKTGPVVLLAALLVIAGVLAGVVVLRPTKARVLVTSEPAGAAVLLDGRPVGCQTPCTLPETTAAGDHRVELTKSGFKPVSSSLPVPETGERTESFRLEKLPVESGPVKVPAFTEVALTVTSEPVGATVTLDGEPRGVTPLTVKRAPGAVAVVIALEGFQGFSERLELGATEAEVLKAVTLSPLTKEPANAVKREGPVRVGPEVKAAMGMVRFVVKPYANVECPPYRFGDTPFEEKRMAAGDYKCVFTNGELGKVQTKSVHVEPGVLNKVMVTFE